MYRGRPGQKERASNLGHTGYSVSVRHVQRRREPGIQFGAVEEENAQTHSLSLSRWISHARTVIIAMSMSTLTVPSSSSIGFPCVMKRPLLYLPHTIPHNPAGVPSTLPFFLLLSSLVIHFVRLAGSWDRGLLRRDLPLRYLTCMRSLHRGRISNSLESSLRPDQIL